MRRYYPNHEWLSTEEDKLSSIFKRYSVENKEMYTEIMRLLLANRIRAIYSLKLPRLSVYEDPDPRAQLACKVRNAILKAVLIRKRGRCDSFGHALVNFYGGAVPESVHDMTPPSVFVKMKAKRRKEVYGTQD